jgi:hypothetical protein
VITQGYVPYRNAYPKFNASNPPAPEENKRFDKFGDNNSTNKYQNIL